MTELILSDITIMGQGYCVLGLEEISPEVFRSIRPMPPRTFAWRDPFPFRRGDCVTACLSPIQVAGPHFEDRQSEGMRAVSQRMPEEQLIRCLRQAEIAKSLEGLYGCPTHAGSQGGGALWVDPAAARRSVCGCEYANVRFRIFAGPDGHTLRAEIVLESEDRIPSIPIVDRAWRRFVDALVRQVTRSDPLPLVERFLNRRISPVLLTSPHRFARIGLPRPRQDLHCWLMLDSLFPQPHKSWLDWL